jgi:hypothetical protein
MVRERGLGQNGEGLGHVGGAVVTARDVGFFSHDAGCLDEGVHDPVDGLRGCLDEGVEGLHLGVQVLPESDLHDKVLPFSLASLQSSRAVWHPDCIGEEPTLQFSQASFANAEEEARFFSLRV